MQVGRSVQDLRDQVSLRGSFLPLRGAAAPECGREAGVRHLALHLARSQPVDVEFDAETGALASAPQLAVTSLERRHQVAARLDDASKLAEGGWPVGRREEHQ